MMKHQETMYSTMEMELAPALLELQVQISSKLIMVQLILAMAILKHPVKQIMVLLSL